mmetsp:Transcript_103342/g.183596  ORF Transcript_103342/g.183596 Transcript_103342/m.183596 type:complete len:247 (-) Transcript_103342:88-828(-)
MLKFSEKGSPALLPPADSTTSAWKVRPPRLMVMYDPVGKSSASEISLKYMAVLDSASMALSVSPSSAVFSSAVSGSMERSSRACRSSAVKLVIRRPPFEGEDRIHCKYCWPLALSRAVPAKTAKVDWPCPKYSKAQCAATLTLCMFAPLVPTALPICSSEISMMSRPRPSSGHVPVAQSFELWPGSFLSTISCSLKWQTSRLRSENATMSKVCGGSTRSFHASAPLAHSDAHSASSFASWLSEKRA